MKRLTLATLVAALVAGQAATAGAADDNASAAAAEATALARRAIAAENAGDIATIQSLWAPGDHAIVDNFPPFSWRGAHALTAWLTDYGKEAARAGETEAVSRIGPPLYVRADGDRIYAVFPDTFTYKRGGATVREDLLWTLVAIHTPQGLKMESVVFTGGPR
jgi:hypothetical protein